MSKGTRRNICVKMSEELVERIDIMADILGTSRSNTIKTAVLLLEQIISKPEKVYEEIATCIWIEIYSENKIPTNKCITRTFIEKLKQEAEKK